MARQYIVVYGNPVDGLSFYGPFGPDDYDDICENLSYGADDSWTIATLEPIGDFNGN